MMKIQSCRLVESVPAVKTMLGVVFCLIALLLPVSPVGAYQAASIPWSGYWWPVLQGGLGTGGDYRGHPAPLEKYNLFTSGVTTGEALTQYLSMAYDPTAPAWYGLCLHWARAACFEPGNILPSSDDNIVFRVGDKKGLLTLAHHADILEKDDGSWPETFHYWLLHYIKDQQKAFTADLWAGTEVWSYPVYKYEMQISGSGAVQSVWVKIYYADDFVSPDFMGTQTRTNQYTYDLFLDGSGAITGGQWTGFSVTDHPENLSVPLGVGTGFPGLDYQQVVKLATSSDDFLEQGSRIVDIGPGTYNLILLDEDVYRFPVQAGDTFSLHLEKQAGSAQDIQAVITDGENNDVWHDTITDKHSADELLTVDTPPYTLHLTQAEDYTTDPNIYTLALDLKKKFSQEIPYIPKSGGWSGFALTNPTDAPVGDVILASRDADGVPIQTLLGPLQLAPGEKQRFFFSDFDVPIHELINTERLTLLADGPVALLNLVGNGDQSLAAFVQNDARGYRLVIPDTAPAMIPGVRMFGGVRNESFADMPVKLSLYSATGELQDEVIETIAPAGYLTIKPGSDPFYNMPSSGWIEVQADVSASLSGFQYLSNDKGVETMFALPVESARKIVPHIARPDYWVTTVTLINPGNTENAVNFHAALAGGDMSGDDNIVLAPHEKRTMELQDLFGASAGDPLYHSILEITGEFPLTGYYAYNRIGVKEYAALPLLDESDFKQTLYMPHYAGNNGGFWWTGVVVCNPSSVSERVRIEPYDADGQLMEKAVETLDLNAGAYDVMDVQARFGEAASDISFINFRATGDTQGIGGFYLYGNRRNTNILSGANM
jgi:hypothetical protein